MPRSRAKLLAPSYPPGRTWDEPLARAAAAGRFRVEAAVNGADQVICATGFRDGVAHDPLLRSLVVEHGLETADGHLVLAADAPCRRSPTTRGRSPSPARPRSSRTRPATR